MRGGDEGGPRCRHSKWQQEVEGDLNSFIPYTRARHSQKNSKKPKLEENQNTDKKKTEKTKLTRTQMKLELGTELEVVTMRIWQRVTESRSSNTEEGDWWMSAAEDKWTQVKGVELMTVLKRDWGNKWGGDRTLKHQRHQNNMDHDTLLIAGSIISLSSPF